MKRYFGKRSFDHHPSKMFVFKHVCGGCGISMKRNGRRKVGNLCKTCAPHYESKDGMCDICRFEMECIARVQLGLWLRCETPDIADLERLKMIGGSNDEETRALVDMSLAGRGSRKILEEAVSQSAQALYQSHFTWIEGETAYALRV